MAERSSLSNKALGIGLVIGLIIGLFLGYGIAPQGVDTSELEQQITDLERQVNTLQSQIGEKDNQINNLQSQIAELESQIEELEQLVPPLRKGKWNTIITLTGSSDKTTELFYIPSGTWRINWSYIGGEMAVFGFFVYPEGETTFFVESVSTMGPSKSDTTYIYEGPKNFYIKVVTGVEWAITVEAFVPE